MLRLTPSDHLPSTMLRDADLRQICLRSPPRPRSDTFGRRHLWSIEFCRSPWNLSEINFSIPNAGKFATLDFPVGGATGVLYARRSADGISTGDRTESALAQLATLFSRANS